MNRLRTQLTRFALALTLPATSHAANLAFDNASSSAYESGPGFLNFEDDQEITHVRIFADATGGPDPEDFSTDAFINSMIVVPEPSTSLLGALAGVGCLLRRRRG